MSQVQRLFRFLLFEGFMTAVAVIDWYFELPSVRPYRLRCPGIRLEVNPIGVSGLR